jgi:parallel beta-helix repeat protein
MKKILLVFTMLVLISMPAFSTSIEVSGNISSNTTWDVDTVFVVGDVTVDDSYTLTIQPGVKVIANGFYKLNIQGAILAEGTETDSILFTAEDHEAGWNRILFDSTPATNDTSRFSYCIIEYGMPILDDSTYYRNGGAFFVDYFHKLIISNSIIRNNNGMNTAIYLNNSSATIENCDIYNNAGYGICILGSFSLCKIYNNKIHDNNGSGMYPGYSSQADIVGNLIYNNSGWGIFCWESVSRFINNTIVDNNCGGIDFNSNSNNELYNNIIYGNSVTQIELNNTCDPDFYYCDIEGGTEGFTGDGAGTEYTGQYENCIDSDPAFVDTLNFNYTLLEGSPCLDAGTPDVTGLNLPPTDAAGNARIIDGRVDIGSYEGPHPAVSVEDTPTNIIKSFALSQNYPNPFNPVTTIHYELPNAAHVTIEVFNVMGQKVQTLINEQKPAGEYNLLLNGKDLSSGIYFYHIKAGRFVDVKKMVLLK